MHRILCFISVILSFGFATAGFSQDESTAAPTIREMAIGAEDAPVTLIEYASFTCPHCARFHTDVYPLLKENYIDQGKLRLVVREVYAHRFGLWASMVARCGNGERFFPIQDMIFENQGEWTQATSPQAAVEELKRYGALAGLPMNELDQCLADAAKAEALVGWYQENAERDNIRGTPSFVLNGKTLSNLPYEDLAAEIDRALAQSS